MIDFSPMTIRLEETKLGGPRKKSKKLTSRPAKPTSYELATSYEPFVEGSGCCFT